MFVQENEEEESAGRRPRRSRKEINYAELNDVQLPRLGPDDFVQSGSNYSSSGSVSKCKRTNQDIQEDCLSPHYVGLSWRQRERDTQNVRKFEKPSQNGHTLLDEEGSGYTDDDDGGELSSVRLFEGDDFVKYTSSDEVDSVSSDTELTVTFQRDNEDTVNVHKVHRNLISIKEQAESTTSIKNVPTDIQSKQPPFKCTEFYDSLQINVEDNEESSTDEDNFGENNLLCLAHVCGKGENPSVGPNSQCLDSESSDLDIV